MLESPSRRGLFALLAGAAAAPLMKASRGPRLNVPVYDFLREGLWVAGVFVPKYQLVERSTSSAADVAKRLGL